MNREIVYVDDQPGFHSLFRAALEAGDQKAQWRLTCFSDGEAALAYLRMAEKPRLVLLDVGMASLDGDPLMERIRKVEGLADLRIVLVTASEVESEHGSKIAAGQRADGFLLKPYGFQELVNLMSELLRALGD